MLIELFQRDRLLGLKALAIYKKGIETAQQACAKVYASPLELQSAEEGATSTADWIQTELSEDIGIGEAVVVNMPHHLALWLRLATSLYLAQLAKLADKELDMLVPLDNTNEIVSHLQSLADRLKGQTEFAGTVG